jgi:hypothetical protein
MSIRSSRRHDTLARQLVARAVGHITSTGVRSAVDTCTPHKAARVRFSGHSGDAAGRFVDRGRITGLVQPTGEVISAQVVGHRQAGRIIGLQGEVELAEQGTFVPSPR